MAVPSPFTVTVLSLDSLLSFRMYLPSIRKATFCLMSDALGSGSSSSVVPS